MKSVSKRLNRWVRVVAAMILAATQVVMVMSQSAVAGPDASRVQLRVEMDRSVLAAKNPQQAVVKVTLDAPPPPENKERPAVNLAIVLDRSGSMAGAKLKKAKQAAVEAFRHLGSRDVFSVVVYDHNVQTVVPAQRTGNTEWIEGQIRSIGPGGNTALFGGVSQGAAEVRKNLDGNFVHRIILLSDGLANVGPSTPEDLGRLGAALIKENVSVTTVGVGTDYNEDLMTRLSQNSDGNSYFVESSVDLPRIFTAELGDVLSVVAQKVRLVIQCPVGVRPLNIIGRQGRINGQSVSFYLNQLYGSQEKFALLQVEISGGRSGQSREVAQARVFYENPFTRSSQEASGRVVVSFSEDPREVEQSTNVLVFRDYQLNLGAIDREEAISLSDEGKKDEAVLKLKDAARRMKEAGMAVGDQQLLDQAEEAAVEADEIETKGMTKKARKVLRTKSYQMKTQQSNQ